MADSNSKKPMALLLLVVVAVLVVIMVSGGDSFTSHADLKTQEDCDKHGGAWTATMKAAEGWDDSKTKADCEAIDGASYTEGKPATTAGNGKDGIAGNADDTVDADAVKHKCEVVDAEADPAGTCAADYASKTTKETCEAGHGAWNEAVAEDLNADPKVDAKDAFCGEPVAAE